MNSIPGRKKGICKKRGVGKSVIFREFGMTGIHGNLEVGGDVAAKQAGGLLIKVLMFHVGVFGFYFKGILLTECFPPKFLC